VDTSTSASNFLHEARFWKGEEGTEAVDCGLCPHHCHIIKGRRGVCGVRQNVEGRLYTLIYGMVSSMHVDPMEKKPLFHYRPGEPVLSLGSVGCNLRCLHCQNFTISQAAPSDGPLERYAPNDVARLARQNKCRTVAFTYNEPTIWHEFTFETAQVLQGQGISSIYVSNGFMETQPLRELAPYLGAMNIDVKGFTEGFYRKVCKASLGPVLKATKLAHELGVHLELTYLIIPAENDDPEEMRSFCRWVVKELDAKVPVHFSRFHPDYMMTDVPPTPTRTMELAVKIGKEEGLKFVYQGNMSSAEGESTRCPNCGTLIIRRYGYSIDRSALKGTDCYKCGEPLNLVL
jgi:pyruvate formate lyase activating enzyme